MKEHPILFTGDMVRAILEGQKTQTRRVVKPQPVLITKEVCKVAEGLWTWYKGNFVTDWWCNNLPDESGIEDYCPYGQVGTRLWAKETWALVGDYAIDPCLNYRVDGKQVCIKPQDIWDESHHCFRRGVYSKQKGWRSSRFMPRWASRITLGITGIRVERVQEISDEDAIAEGIIGYAARAIGKDKEVLFDYIQKYPSPKGYVGSYAKLWDSINGKKYSWSSNPWVWVIEFKRVQQ